MPSPSQSSFADRINTLTANKGAQPGVVSPADQPKVDTTSFTDRIYNLLAGKSTFDNPNVGKSIKTEVPQIAKPNQAIDVPTDWKPAISDASSKYPDLPTGLIPSVLMMESSMGTNSSTKKLSIGENGWIGGLDKTGRFADTLANMKKLPNADYKIRDTPGIDTLATPYAAIQAVASVLTQLKNENPNANLVDLYFSKYVTNKKSDTPARRKLFSELLSYYAKQSTGAIASAQ